MRKSKDKNYMEFIPCIGENIVYEKDENGMVIVSVEWKGFYHKIAQIFFHRPKVSEIKLDDYGSYVWLSIDGSKSVYNIAIEMEKNFPDMPSAVPRLIKFLEILREHKLIRWKGERRR